MQRCFITFITALAGFVVSLASMTPACAQYFDRGQWSTHIFPPGAQRGAEITIGVGAECIPPGTRFEMDGAGVTVLNSVLEHKLPVYGVPSPRRTPKRNSVHMPDHWESRIRVADDAPLGGLYWRLHWGQGGTESRVFVIGDLPEYIEQETIIERQYNSTPVAAERLELPVTLNGIIYGERDIDYYRVSLSKGDVLVGDVMARRLQSKLDPLIEIRDAAGHRLDFEQISAGSDDVVAFRAPADGDYFFSVANVDHYGTPGHVYRVKLTADPYVHFAYPSGGQVGTAAAVDFHVLTGTGEPRIERRTVQFPAGQERFDYRFDHPGANAIPFAVSDHPSLTDTEGNESPADAVSVSIPQSVFGRFIDAVDQDWYQFDAREGEKLLIRCGAYPLVSRALPVVRLIDEQGQELAHEISAASDDRQCVLDWTAPCDGRYRLCIRDVRYGGTAGDDLLYRLSVEHSQPDFQLLAETDLVNIEQRGPEAGGKYEKSSSGKPGSLDLVVSRFGGFDAPIDLTFEELPEGVEPADCQIPAGKSTFTVKFRTTNGIAPVASALVRIVGTAEVDGTMIRRVTLAKHLAADCDGVGFVPPRRDQVHVCVAHPPTFRLWCSEAYHNVPRAAVYPYLMHVERLGSFKGEIHLHQCSRQWGDMDDVEIWDAVIPAEETSGHVPIYMPQTMHLNDLNTSQLFTQGSAHITDEQGRRHGFLVISEKRNVLWTLPQVISLLADETELSAQAGAVVACPLRLERTPNYSGPMRIELHEVFPRDGAVLADGENVTILAGERETTVPVRISTDLKPGAQIELTFRAIGQVDGQYSGLLSATYSLVNECTVHVRVGNRSKASPRRQAALVGEKPSGVE